MLTKYAMKFMFWIVGCILLSIADCSDLSRQRRDDTDDVWKPADPLPEYTQHANYHLFPQQPECGVPTLFDNPTSEAVEARITNGHDVKLGQFPWVVLIKTMFSTDPTKWRCTGSIINKKYILSANHCFMPQSNGDVWSNIDVHVGDWDTSTDPDVQGDVEAPSALVVKVEEVIPHDDFYDNRPTFLWFDVALLRLENELTFSDFVKPICLPFNHKATQYQYAGERMAQAGWGLIDKSEFPKILQKLTTTVAVWERCRDAWDKEQSYLLNESHVCLDVKDNVMTCKGDSGTPLMYAQVRREKPEETIFYILGVNSYGVKCFRNNTNPPYKVSTWVPAILEWIMNKISLVNVETDDMDDVPADNLPEYTQHANYHLFPQQPECGVPKLFDSSASEAVEARIMNGQYAKLGEFPWVVLIEIMFTDDPTKWKCTGSIINKKYILSANQCFLPGSNGGERSNIDVHVGDWNTNTDPDVQGDVEAPSELVMKVEEVIPHEDFVDKGPKFFSFDVALLRLENELTFNDFVKPICLPFNHKATQNQYAGERVTQAGWGRLDRSDFPNILQKLTTTISVWEKCRDALNEEESYLENDKESQVCVDVKDNVMPCEGDSGAPLMYAHVRRNKPEETIFYILGVHSFGVSCFQDNTDPPYKVSTWVPAIVKWIMNKVKE